MVDKFTCSFLFMFCSIILAQDMQEGFNFLETGKYKEASLFFENILKEYPENKTAKLCYGRAVGLSGDSEKAILIFTALRNQFPEDFEIKLNYAESLLWDRQFPEAEPFYKKLTDEQPTSFPAVLGYANTLSNLKKYPLALKEVTKALNLQKGNANALISRKYIRLGYANQISQNKEYEKALAMLAQNLVDFPNDKDTQLNRANIYLITKKLDSATAVYKEIATNTKDSIIAMNGLALIAHQKHKEKKALEITRTNIKKAERYANSDAELYFSAKERYIQALLWNQKFSTATQEIEKLQSAYPNNNSVLSLSASSGMYTSHFKKSIKNYTQILSVSESSFDGNLGIANAYRATANDMKAYEYAFKTLHFYPKQPDAEKLIQTLKKSHTPFIEEKTTFTFDNGDNEAVSLYLNSEIPFSTKFKTTASYTYRTTKNEKTAIDAKSHTISAGLNYIWNGRISMSGNIGVTSANGRTNTFTSLLGEIIIKTKPFRLHNLDIGYRRELQNFNADLINREILMNHYLCNYNLSTNFNLGWFTQYMYTLQTDDNTRNLVFTSLYYSILRRPVLKTGINYQYISFANQVPTTYFSPEKFHLTEIFAELVSDPQKKWFFQISAALGKQFVEEDPASTTFRAESKLGYRFSNRFITNIYGKYSNIASATAAGFRFTEFGFKLKWYFLPKPIFDKKIMLLKKEAE
ncbi:hypothetical protein [Aquimarina sp. RZ0]|uniref:hypothetical protein n=1 Tax=Aquimarina sp. RZ0 TaxID=2607730 RepID=UPI0011F2D37B|nr:hypothetical protein [Aquimarina sp. RZ0]KAA1243292.1 hypothetical protein F0000_21810 [Aquimarina sp. RZ0]